MNKEKVRLWVDALRSGDYQQGQDHLSRYVQVDVRQFCCLGVVCEVAIKDGLDLEVNTGVPDENVVVLYGAAREDTHLPYEVRQWLELRGGRTPYVNVQGDEQRSVIELNDAFEWSFDQIADALEAQFLKEGK